jgi:sortase A
MKKAKKGSLIIGIIFLIVAFGFVLYPLISNTINNCFALSTIDNYKSKVADLKDSKSRYLTDAEEYNHNLSKLVNDFTYSSDSVIDGYDNILNFGDGLIGYIEIPKINVKLPIYHGDRDKVLEKGVAHIPNTAFPIGGIGNHSVLSAHTGYPTQVFFDNLDDLAIGDEIKVSVLDETLIYKVTAKNIVKPDNISLLSVDDRKDLISLITCYPYGVNSHRLIVTAERLSEIPSTTDENKSSVENTISPILVIVVVAILTVSAAVMLFIRKIKRKTKNE